MGSCRLVDTLFGLTVVTLHLLGDYIRLPLKPHESNDAQLNDKNPRQFIELRPGTLVYVLSPCGSDARNNESTTALRCMPIIHSVGVHNNCLAVNGAWSDWSRMETCSAKPCSGLRGFRVKFRSCTNPRPSLGGMPCRGRSWIREPCYNNDFCTERGQWVKYTMSSSRCTIVGSAAESMTSCERRSAAVDSSR